MTTEMADIDEAVDWQGAEVRCEICVHSSLRAEGRCDLKRACVRDCYARRIDRFFCANPGLAHEYLAHPYFEVRAIAARHADIFYLPDLLKDPDEAVRWSAAARLPTRYRAASAQRPASRSAHPRGGASGRRRPEADDGGRAIITCAWWWPGGSTLRRCI